MTHGSVFTRCLFVLATSADEQGQHLRNLKKVQAPTTTELLMTIVAQKDGAFPPVAQN